MTKINQILAQYDIKAPYQIKRLTAGLIHQTFHVTHISSDESNLNTHQEENTQWILQGLHPKLSSLEIRTDYQRITHYLSQKGYPGPTLISCKNGDHYVQDDEGTYWRLCTYVPGQTYEEVDNLDHIRLGAQALAQFHSLIQIKHKKKKKTTNVII